LCLKIRGRFGAIILLSKKNCGIPYSFLPSSYFSERKNNKKKEYNSNKSIILNKTIKMERG
jgi:hypothetical protein